MIPHDPETPEWLGDVAAIVDGCNPTFTTANIYAHEAELKARHPGNNNVRAKIRQTLQKLRDLTPRAKIHAGAKPGHWTKANQ